MPAIPSLPRFDRLNPWPRVPLAFVKSARRWSDSCCQPRRNGTLERLEEMASALCCINHHPGIQATWHQHVVSSEALDGIYDKKLQFKRSRSDGVYISLAASRRSETRPTWWCWVSGTRCGQPTCYTCRHLSANFRGASGGC